MLLCIQVEHCKLASLAVALTLAQCDNTGKLNDDTDDTPEGSISDVAAFVSGVLLGGDMNVRKWFATFVKNGQKVRNDGVRACVHVCTCRLGVVGLYIHA